MTYYNEARTHLSLDKDAPIRAKFKASAGLSQNLILADCIVNMFGFDVR